MSRSYTKVRPKAHHVYLVEGVMELFAVSRNTVSNWVRQGLRPSDGAQPYVFRGAELIRFHKVRQATGTGLARGFFHCMRCKEAVVPQLSELSIAEERPKVFRARARCPDCGAALSKLLGETECTIFRNCLETNTSLDSIVEEIIENPAGIGKFRSQPDDEVSRNDRLLMQWLGHAGRYDPKTVTAHLASIRAFEAFVGGKSFAMLTVQDAENWRSTMIATEGGGLSRGTLRHRASHLRLFFGWLGKQTGYRNLAALDACFDLPRRFQAKTIPQPRAWPEMDEAVAMLKAMPTDTLIDQRARAIFAFAFLTGFRADALITVRLRHIDLKGRKAIHDGKEMRTKNGKSFVVHWFPRTEAFAAVVEDWMALVTKMRLRPNDALFPEIRMLQQAADPECRDAIEPMQSISAVTDAFRIASRGVTQDYSPHSARHTLAHVGDQLCRTGEQRKAWSLNLGHSSEAINRDHISILKLRRGEQLTAQDLSELERIWNDAGFTQDIGAQTLAEAGGLPRFLRALTGMDRASAKAAFSSLTSVAPLSADQIEFLDLIIDTLSENGEVDPARFYESPFTDIDAMGIGAVFGSDRAQEVIRIVRELNAAVSAAA